MKWVVDASVAAKWLAPEADSAYAEALLDDDLSVPDLLYAEVANILWKKQLRGEMDTAAVRLAGRWLQQVPFVVHDSADLLIDALDLALQLQHPACDCFYLALARRAGLPLITADKRLVARCQTPAAGSIGDSVVMLAPAPAR